MAAFISPRSSSSNTIAHAQICKDARCFRLSLTFQYSVPRQVRVHGQRRRQRALDLRFSLSAGAHAVWDVLTHTHTPDIRGYSPLVRAREAKRALVRTRTRTHAHSSHYSAHSHAPRNLCPPTISPPRPRPRRLWLRQTGRTRSHTRTRVRILCVT